MSEPYSITSRTPSAYYDLDSQCLKTSQQSLLSEAPALLQRLPDSGMTVDGWLFALPMPERLTAERDGFVSLPTLIGRGFEDYKGTGENVKENQEE